MSVRARSAIVLGVGVAIGASACSLATTFAGYVGDVPADAATRDAGAGDAPTTGALDDAGDADAGGDAGVTICRPGFKGATCSDPCPKNTAGLACEFALVYGLDVPASGTWATVAAVPYSSNSASTVPTFARVAYHLALDQDEVWIEMDAFTQDATQLGVPVNSVFDMPIKNVLVFSFASNQNSILTKTGGHIQLWSNCYDADGDGGAFDGLDAIQTSQPNCYGTMQVNVDGSPVLSFHRWANSGSSNLLDLGIGPSSDPKHTDWTFAKNSADFSTRRLEVYAH